MTLHIWWIHDLPASFLISHFDSTNILNRAKKLNQNLINSLGINFLGEQLFGSQK
jgi:hypothetical protein